MAESPVIIVTGAGSGIGRAVCERLARDGARLVLAGRTLANLQETQRLLRPRDRDSVHSLVIQTDISDHRAADSVVDETLRTWGRVDALVNNAAVLEVTPMESIDEPHLQRTFATNTFGPGHLIARCWPTLVKQRHGRIINVSSVATVDPFPGLAAYGASKAALESLTRSINVEGKAHGIMGFSIVLGAVETSMLRLVVSKQELSENRVLDPSEAAEVIADCAIGKRDSDAGEAIVVSRR